MAFTHSFNSQDSNGSNRLNYGLEVTDSNGAEQGLDESIPDGSTDLQVNVSVTAAQLKSWSLGSDQDVTIKTNSSGAPQETITLKANFPQRWVEGSGTSPIAGDITAFFITNSSGSPARVQLLAGWDPT